MAALQVAAQLAVAVAFAVLWRWAIRRGTPLLQAWVRAQPWGAVAVANQRRALCRMGFAPQTTDDAVALDMYAFFFFVAVAHLLCALCLAPAALGGWVHCGAAGRGLFLVGILADVGFDLQDLTTVFRSTFFPVRCGVPRTPFWQLFLPIALHHPAAILLVIPANVYHPGLRDYPFLAFALLSAAAVCCGLGSYKLTLDVTTLPTFRRMQAVVAVQCAATIYARAYLWGPGLASIAAELEASGDRPLYYGCLGCGALLTAFNVMMVGDAVMAALKWLPRAGPAAVSIHRAGTPALSPPAPKRSPLPSPAWLALLEVPWRRLLERIELE